MSTFPDELDSLLTENVPLVDIPSEANYQQQVQDQVAQLGPNPTLIQAVALLLSGSAKAEHEARQARQQLAHSLGETVKVVKAHHGDIETLKGKITSAEAEFGEMKEGQSNIVQRMGQLELVVSKTYSMTCENQQRSSKGNFILSGEQIPKYRPGEDLLNLVRDLVYRKYEIDIEPQEFKVIHRLPGDRIIFVLHSRLPGWSFEQLIRAMNSNPNAGVKIYVSIQLFEPFSELFYIARRLKFYKTISYYRLDENGYTFIALNEQSKAFKFTNLDQLSQLQVQVPPQIYNEINERRRRIAESETQKAEQNIRKAQEPRPNIPPKVDQRFSDR